MRPRLIGCCSFLKSSHKHSQMAPESSSGVENLESRVMSDNKCGQGPSTEVIMIDDKSYLEDGLPLRMF